MNDFNKSHIRNLALKGDKLNLDYTEQAKKSILSSRDSSEDLDYIENNSDVLIETLAIWPP